MDVVVYSLLGDVYTSLAKHYGNLTRRPIVLYYHLVYAPPQFLRLAVVPFKPMFAPRRLASPAVFFMFLSRKTLRFYLDSSAMGGGGGRGASGGLLAWQDSL